MKTSIEPCSRKIWNFTGPLADASGAWTTTAGVVEFGLLSTVQPFPLSVPSAVPCEVPAASSRCQSWIVFASVEYGTIAAFDHAAANASSAQMERAGVMVWFVLMKGLCGDWNTP